MPPYVPYHSSPAAPLDPMVALISIAILVGVVLVMMLLAFWQGHRHSDRHHPGHLH